MTEVLSPEQRQMVVDNLPLVEHIVNRVAAGLPRSYSRDDLVQTGTLGLISAATRFDVEMGTAFSTYAGRRIEGAVIDMLRQTDWAPRSVRALQRRLAYAESTVGTHASTRNGDDAPGRHEIAARIAQELGVSVDELDRVRGNIEKARLESLDQPVRNSVSGDQGASSLSSLVPASGDTVEEHVDNQEMIGYLREGISLLPERHRLVVAGFFFEGQSMTDLGALLGVSQSRASQLKEEAIRMLRAGLNQVYAMAGDQQAPLSARHQAFSDSLAGSSSWRDRLDTGRGLSISG